MRTIRITLSDEEHAFIKTKGNAYVRGLVQADMAPAEEKAEHALPELPASVFTVPQPANVCPSCGKPYKNLSLLGPVCYNEDCGRYKVKP